MTQSIDFEPNSSVLSREVNNGLLKSFEHLLWVAQTNDVGLGKNNARFVLDLLDTFLSDSLSPLLFSIHFRLKNSIERCDYYSAQTQIDQLCQFSHVYIPSERILSFSDFINHDYGRRLINEVRTDYFDTYLDYLNFIKSENETKSVDMAKSALGTIKTVCPGLFLQFDKLYSKIIICKSGVSAGSCFRTLGMIYMNVEEKGNWTRYFGDLVHEGAHNQLFCLSTMNQLVSNNNEMYMTPLREEPRPLYMVYHQMYVLFKTAIAVDKLSNSQVGHNLNGNIHNSYTKKSVHEDYYAAYKILENNRIKLTEYGNSLLDHCKL